MSFTVWSYAYDAAPHHDNDLAEDTFEDESSARSCGRKRASLTAHNTGWSKVVDNSKAGRGGSGTVCTFSKTVRGVVRIRCA